VTANQTDSDDTDWSISSMNMLAPSCETVHTRSSAVAVINQFRF